MKTKKKVTVSIIISLLVVISIIAGASLFMISYSLKPDFNRDEEISFKNLFGSYPHLESWVDSLQTASALKDTFILNKEDRLLHAYYIRAPRATNRTAVIVHGYTDNAISMMMIGYMFNHEMNYNILLPDLQYHGRSEGTAIRMGWKDRIDVMEWMDVANNLYGKNTQMVIHGISMGAATAMMISGEELPAYVKCFIEDCGYTSVWEQFSKELKEQFGLPQFPLMYTANWLNELKYGWSFKEASALEQVRNCHLPMFFIHGDADSYVPTQMVYSLYEAKPEPKELWVVPGATHAKSYLNNTGEYTTRVKAFVNKYIK